MNVRKNIEVGDTFICIKDVVMKTTGEIAYVSGKTYKSEVRGCLTNEQNFKLHNWSYSWMTEYFKPSKTYKIDNESLTKLL